MPAVVHWILEGKFRRNVLRKNCIQLPNIHQCAFDGTPSKIATKYKRYSILQCAWEWVLEKEEIHSAEKENTGHYVSALGKDDCDLLHQTFLWPF